MLESGGGGNERSADSSISFSLWCNYKINYSHSGGAQFEFDGLTSSCCCIIYDGPPYHSTLYNVSVKCSYIKNFYRFRILAGGPLTWGFLRLFQRTFGGKFITNYLTICRSVEPLPQFGHQLRPGFLSPVRLWCCLKLYYKRHLLRQIKSVAGNFCWFSDYVYKWAQLSEVGNRLRLPVNVFIFPR
jgi:hypothetical protein